MAADSVTDPSVRHPSGVPEGWGTRSPCSQGPAATWWMKLFLRKTRLVPIDEAKRVSNT